MLSVTESHQNFQEESNVPSTPKREREHLEPVCPGAPARKRKHRKPLTRSIQRTTTKPHPLEELCRNGTECRGFINGACPYNHFAYPDGKKVPLCKSEMVPERACNNSKCRFNHLEGHAIFVEHIQRSLGIGPKFRIIFPDEADIEADIEAPRTPDRPTVQVLPDAPERPVRLTSDIVSAGIGLPVRVLPPPLPLHLEEN